MVAGVVGPGGNSSGGISSGIVVVVVLMVVLDAGATAYALWKKRSYTMGMAGFANSSLG